MPPSDATRIWDFSRDAVDGHRVSVLLMKDRDLTFVDMGRVGSAEEGLRRQHGIIKAEVAPLPEFTPPLVLNHDTGSDLLLDYFTLNIFRFCSKRLRTALDLPDHAIQYIPLDVKTSDPRIAAMEYQLMRVLVSHSVLDMQTAAVTLEDRTDRFLGTVWRTMIGLKTAYKMRPDFTPAADLFHLLESPTLWYATDRLAERVIQAGCQGVEFTDPEHPYALGKDMFVRTARGIEPRSPATRRAHLRLVKLVREREQGQAAEGTR